jgi:hypothetical protein
MIHSAYKKGNAIDEVGGYSVLIFKKLTKQTLIDNTILRVDIELEGISTLLIQEQLKKRADKINLVLNNRCPIRTN